MLAQSGSRARMLALVGDRYHNPDYIRVALTKTFDGLKISVDYTMHYEQLSRESAKELSDVSLPARRNDLAGRISGSGRLHELCRGIGEQIRFR